MESWYAAGERAQVEGLEVFYRRAGEGDVLVCLHGFPTSSWDYEPLWSDLTARFDVVAHDLIGLGRSAKPQRALPVALQASVVEGLLGELGIERAHLLAHDLGDTVAQELLARQLAGTAEVEWSSCVFLNGGLFPETHQPRLIQRLLASPLGSFVAKLTSERTFRRAMTRICSPQHPLDDDFYADSWRLLIENDGRSMMPRLIRYMAERKTMRERWVEPLTSAQIPLRLINGVLDPVSGRHAAERYRQLVPDADVVLLEEGGHYPHVEQPSEVLSAFFAFHDGL